LQQLKWIDCIMDNIKRCDDIKLSGQSFRRQKTGRSRVREQRRARLEG
jgi:hypothetical protein